MAVAPSAVKRTGKLLIHLDGEDGPVEIGTLELSIPISYTPDSLRLGNEPSKNPA